MRALLVASVSALVLVVALLGGDGRSGGERERRQDRSCAGQEPVMCRVHGTPLGGRDRGSGRTRLSWPHADGQRHPPPRQQRMAFVRAARNVGLTLDVLSSVALVPESLAAIRSTVGASGAVVSALPLVTA